MRRQRPYHRPASPSLLALAACLGPLALAVPALAQRIDTRVGGGSNSGRGAQPGPAGAGNPGDGRALDANLRVGSGGYNEPARDLNALIRFNNAVIYGQAQGKSFRDGGAVTDPFEFRGTLDTNDLYAFRRDTASAALVARGIRTSDALQYQFDLSAGRPVAPPISLALIPTRGARAASGASLAAARSTAQFEWEQSRRPSVLGYQQERNGRAQVLTASPLRGLSTSYITDERGDELLSGMERSPVGLGASSAARSGLILDRSIDRRIDTKADVTPTAYDRYMERLRREGRFENDVPSLAPPPGGIEPRPPAPGDVTPGGPGTPAGASAPAAPVPEWQRNLDALRERVKPADTLPMRRPTSPSMPAMTPPTPEEAAAETERAARTVDLLKRLRGSPAVADLGGDANDPQALVRQVMAEGQRLLQADRFLDAEGVFARLLAATPGEPMALAGRAHAQLGAGAYVDAAMGLREMFRTHPELIPLRYTGKAIFSKTRAEVLAETLTAEVNKQNSPIGGDAALLLAYLGYQHDNAVWLKKGLDQMTIRYPEGHPDHALAALIIQVWSAPPAEPLKDEPAGVDPAKAPNIAPGGVPVSPEK